MGEGGAAHKKPPESCSWQGEDKGKRSVCQLYEEEGTQKKKGFGILLRDGLINKREEFGRVAVIFSAAMKHVSTWARWSDPKMLQDLKMNVAKEALLTVAHFLHCNGNPPSFPLTRVTWYLSLGRIQKTSEWKKNRFHYSAFYFTIPHHLPTELSLIVIYN